MATYWIYGAGAVGSALAGYLARGGHHVGVTARPAHADAIAASGLKVISYDENFCVPFKAISKAPTDLPPGALILLTMQTHDLPKALQEIDHLASQHPVVTFQNGVQAESMAEAVCPKLYGGIIRFTATMINPGEVRVRRPGQIIVGKHPSGVDGLLVDFVETLTAAGFQAATSQEIGVEKALKLLVNLVSGPAVLMKRTGAEPALAAVQVALLMEARAVYAATGTRALPLSGLGATLDTMIQGFRQGGSAPDGHPVFNSTWQNLYHRRTHMENRYYHGEIMRLGNENEIPTPANQRTLELLEEALEKELGPEPYTPQEFKDKFRGIVDFSRVIIAAEPTLGNLEI